MRGSFVFCMYYLSFLVLFWALLWSVTERKKQSTTNPNVQKPKGGYERLFFLVSLSCSNRNTRKLQEKRFKLIITIIAKRKHFLCHTYLLRNISMMWRRKLFHHHTHTTTWALPSMHHNTYTSTQVPPYMHHHVCTIHAPPCMHPIHALPYVYHHTYIAIHIPHMCHHACTTIYAPPYITTMHVLPYMHLLDCTTKHAHLRWKNSSPNFLCIQNAFNSTKNSLNATSYF